MPVKLGKHWWACGRACPRVVGCVQVDAGGRCGAGRVRAWPLVQQQHEQQHVEQDPLMGFCRNMRCMQLEAGHAAMRALERSKRGLRDRAVWRARQGVLHRSGSGVVDARGAGRNT